MARLLAFVGVIGWMVALLLFGSAIEWAGRPRIAESLVPGPPLVRELNRAHPTGDTRTWAVVRANAAHNVLVVDLDAVTVADAMLIAEQVVNPVLDRGYDEALIYVWEAGTDKPYADRRVQWTPGGGYKEMVLGD